MSCRSRCPPHGGRRPRRPPPSTCQPPRTWRQDTRMPQVLIRSSHRAWVALPLRSSGRTLGILTLAFLKPHPIDDGPDQIILTALGSAVADALSRAIQHDTDRDLVIRCSAACFPRPCPQPGCASAPATCLRRPATASAVTGTTPCCCPAAGSCSWWAMSPATGSKPRSPWGRCEARPRARPDHGRGPARCAGSVRGHQAGRIAATAAVAVIDPPKEHFGIASPDIRPCYCATPTGPGHARRGERAADRLWRGDRPERWPLSSPAAASCYSLTGSWSDAARQSTPGSPGSARRSQRQPR